MSEARIANRAMGMMLAAFTAGALLHVDRAPLWSLAVAATALGWQLARLRWRLPLPGTVVRTLIAFALLLLTAASHRSISGLSAGSTLLLVMGAAKTARGAPAARLPGWWPWWALALLAGRVP